MKQYWHEFMGPRPGMPIRETVTKYDNIYIKDQFGRVWQLWIEFDGPLIQQVGNEDN